MYKNASFIHKSPAIWDRTKFNISDLNYKTFDDLKTNLSEINYSSVFKKMLNEDIYVNTFIELAKKQNIGNINIIQGHVKSEKANWDREWQTGYFKVSEDVTFWSIDDINQLPPFFSSDLLMTRKKKKKLFSDMGEIRKKNNGCWLHYPATSILYPHMEKVFLDWKNRYYDDNLSLTISNNIINFLSTRKNLVWKDIKDLKKGDIKNGTFDSLIEYSLKERLQWRSNSYDVLLIDDIDSLKSKQELFPDTYLLPFIKPFPKSSTNKNNFIRNIDIVFASSTLGPTKNHKLFTKIITNIENFYDGDILSITVIGDEGSLPWFSKFLNSKFKKIKINNLGIISREETLQLFSKSKFCLITSGRDCNPRLIAEANVNGCKIICLNILSDGYSIIEKFPPLGKVIQVPYSNWNFDSRGSPTVINAEEISIKLIDEINAPITPYLTMRVAKKVYSNKKLIAQLSDIIDLLS